MGHPAPGLGEAGAELGGGEALVAQGAEGEGVVALGEADALLIAEERGVEVVDRGEAEGALKEELAGGGFEQVGAADDFGDAHGGVVDYAGELVAGQAAGMGVAGKSNRRSFDGVRRERRTTLRMTSLRDERYFSGVLQRLAPDKAVAEV